MILREEVGERLRDHRSDAFDLGQLGERLGITAGAGRDLGQPRDCPEMAHQIARGDRADMTDADAEQEAHRVRRTLVLDRA